MAFGIVLIASGVVLPFATMVGEERLVPRVLGYSIVDYRFPYLVHGIALVAVGIVLLVAMVILERECKIRRSEALKYPPPPPQNNAFSTTTG